MRAAAREWLDLDQVRLRTAVAGLRAIAPVNFDDAAEAEPDVVILDASVGDIELGKARDGWELQVAEDRDAYGLPIDGA